MVAARAAIQGQSTAFGHCQTLTFAAPRSCHRPMTYGPINGESFRVYIESVLVPTLRPGDFRATGAEALLTTQIFSRLEPDRAVLLQAETLARQAARRSPDAVCDAIGEILNLSATECSNYFKNVGYEQT
jgi:hypothetical protein